MLPLRQAYMMLVALSMHLPHLLGMNSWLNRSPAVPVCDGRHVPGQLVQAGLDGFQILRVNSARISPAASVDWQ